MITTWSKLEKDVEGAARSRPSSAHLKPKSYPFLSCQSLAPSGVNPRTFPLLTYPTEILTVQQTVVTTLHLPHRDTITPSNSATLHLPSRCTSTPTSPSAAATLHIPPRGSTPSPSPLPSPSCVPHVRDYRLQTANERPANGRPVGVSNRVSVIARAASVASGGGCLICSSAFASSVWVTCGAASVATGGARRGRRTE